MSVLASCLSLFGTQARGTRRPWSYYYRDRKALQAVAADGSNGIAARRICVISFCTCGALDTWSRRR
jgi:hypothetical protein